MIFKFVNTLVSKITNLIFKPSSQRNNCSTKARKKMSEAKMGDRNPAKRSEVRKKISTACRMEKD